MELSVQSQRWQGQRSAYSWEQSAVEHIKAQMPDAEPYRAWQTFTFTTDRGHVREVDLLIATPGGLFLVEIKSHPGTAANHGSTWMFRDADKSRTIENPNSTSPAMDALVRDATQVSWADRTDSVREFLRNLDKIEEELTAPEPGPEQDPLTAGAGDEILGWTVLRQLGTGSTSKAPLVSTDGGDYANRVFKVTLNDAATRRLEREVV
jgi:hypothetical protein